MSETATMEREPNVRCQDCGHAASEHDGAAGQCLGASYCGCRAMVWAMQEEE